MDMKKIFLLALCLSAFAILPAEGPVSKEIVDEAEGEPLGAPVFPAEMMVSLWDAGNPVCYQHRDTIYDKEEGTGYNFNRLDFKPDGDDGIIMTWYASASFSSGFYGECTYVYTGTRDLNVVSLDTRRFEDEGEEEAEVLDRAAQDILVTILNPTQLRFNNRIFDRVEISGETE